MKKFLSLLFVLLILCTTFTACDTSSPSGGGYQSSSGYSSSSAPNDNTTSFYDDYNEIVDLVKNYNTHVEFCGKMNLSMMQNCNKSVGIKHFSTGLQVVYRINSIDDYEKEFSGDDVKKAKQYVAALIYGNVDAIFMGEQVQKEIAASCALYNASRKQKTNLKTDISEKMKALRQNYNSYFSADISLLNEWVIESEVYDETVFDFNTTILSYSNSLDEFSKSISRLSKSADIY